MDEGQKSTDTGSDGSSWDGWIVVPELVFGFLIVLGKWSGPPTCIVSRGIHWKRTKVGALNE